MSPTQRGVLHTSSREDETPQEQHFDLGDGNTCSDENSEHTRTGSRSRPLRMNTRTPSPINFVKPGSRSKHPGDQSARRDSRRCVGTAYWEGGAHDSRGSGNWRPHR